MDLDVSRMRQRLFKRAILIVALSWQQVNTEVVV
jgi:hypothetical protein